MDEAQAYITSVETERQNLAQQIREFRAMVRASGHKTRRYNQIWYADCYKATPAVTPYALMRQIRNAAEFAASDIPDFTQDDGYSMCGAEDGAYEAREDAARHAHMLLDALIIQTGRQ